MTRAAKTTAAHDPLAVVPEKLLNEGEVVILALKPSAWFLAMTSWPACLVAAAVAGGAYVAKRGLSLEVRPEWILLLCAALVLAQLFIACCQWAGRLYVLTNVRVLRVRGIFRPEIFQCPLRQIQETMVLDSHVERILAVGTLYFKTDQAGIDEPGWLYISHPRAIQEVVNEAILRSRG